MPRFEVYWQTEDKILVYLTCLQSKRAELVNPRHCGQTDTFLIYLLLLRKADPYFPGLIGCGSKHKPRARRSFSRSSSGKVKKKIGPDRTRNLSSCGLGRSVYLQQEASITPESGKLDFSSSLSTCLNELWRICLTGLVL